MAPRSVGIQDVIGRRAVPGDGRRAPTAAAAVPSTFLVAAASSGSSSGRAE